MDINVSIVIPAHNEEESIISTIEDLIKIKNSEIIVVCNGCTDRTFELVQSKGMQHLKCLNIPENSKAIAVLEGLKHAKAGIIGFVDADGSFESKYLLTLIKELDRADCVIASKWKGKNFFSVKWPMRRKIPGRIWNFLVNFLLQLDIDDTQAGAKFMKKSVYDSIDKDFISEGWELDVELLYKIKKKGFKIKEVYTPVKSTKRVSSFKMKKTPSMFFNLLKIRFGS